MIATVYVSQVSRVRVVCNNDASPSRIKELALREYDSEGTEKGEPVIVTAETDVPSRGIIQFN